MTPERLHTHETMDPDAPTARRIRHVSAGDLFEAVNDSFPGLHLSERPADPKASMELPDGKTATDTDGIIATISRIRIDTTPPDSGAAAEVSFTEHECSSDLLPVIPPSSPCKDDCINPSTPIVPCTLAPSPIRSKRGKRRLVFGHSPVMINNNTSCCDHDDALMLPSHKKQRRSLDNVMWLPDRSPIVPSSQIVASDAASTTTACTTTSTTTPQQPVQLRRRLRSGRYPPFPYFPKLGVATSTLEPPSPLFE